MRRAVNDRMIEPNLERSQLGSVLTEQPVGSFFMSLHRFLSLHRFSIDKPPLARLMHCSMGKIRVRDGADAFTILEAGLVVNHDQAIAFQAVAIDQRRANRQ